MRLFIFLAIFNQFIFVHPVYQLLSELNVYSVKFIVNSVQPACNLPFQIRIKQHRY